MNDPVSYADPSGYGIGWAIFGLLFFGAMLGLAAWGAWTAADAMGRAIMSYRRNPTEYTLSVLIASIGGFAISAVMLVLTTIAFIGAIKNLARVISASRAAAAAKRVASTAEAVKPKPFTSKDKYGTTGKLATDIEKAYPGSVQNIERKIYDSAGKTLTDLDIEMDKIVVQVKGGDTVDGLHTQIQISIAETGKHAVGYMPQATKRMMYFFDQQKVTVFTSLDDLIAYLGAYIGG